MKAYKIWVYIEEVDESSDNYQDVAGPFCLGTYDTEKAARTHVDSLIHYDKVHTKGK